MPKQTRLGDDALIYQPLKEQTEREKLSKMSFQEKLSYIWEYYKLFIIGGAAAIALIIYIINLILHPGVTTEFYAAIINNTVNEDVIDNYSNDFAKQLQLNPKKECVRLDTSYNFSTDNPYASNLKQAFVAHLAAHEVDVIIAPESYFHDYAYYGYLNKLSDQLPADIYSLLTDKLYMSDTEDSKTKNVYGVYLTDIKPFSGTANTKDPYVLGIVGGSKHEDNTIDFIRYLFDKK